jgi:hypothetical protein
MLGDNAVFLSREGGEKNEADDSRDERFHPGNLTRVPPYLNPKEAVAETLKEIGATDP